MRVRPPLSAPTRNLSLVGRFFVGLCGVEHAGAKPVTVLARPVLKHVVTEGDPLSRHNEKYAPRVRIFYCLESGRTLSSTPSIV